MIKSFKCKHTESLFLDTKVKAFVSIAKVARMRLLSLDIATSITDLRSPPGNQLESLKGDRKGQYSIRINKQWRICFSLRDDGSAHDVEIVDLFRTSLLREDLKETRNAEPQRTLSM